MEVIKLLEDMPVIAAVKNEEQLKLACTSSAEVIFVLYGDICCISEITKTIKSYDKTAIIHLDLIDGLENKPISVKFIRENTKADGIISTKPTLIKVAKNLGLIAIQRVFMIDSRAFKSMKIHLEQSNADMIEVLPGVMPKMLKQIVNEVSVPVIAGGLILDKDDVITALNSGVIAVSATSPEIWDM